MDNIYAGVFGMAIYDALYLGGVHIPLYGAILVGLACGIIYVEVKDRWSKLWRK